MTDYILTVFYNQLIGMIAYLLKGPQSPAVADIVDHLAAARDGIRNLTPLEEGK
jgi:hypothetical protein